MNAWRTSPCWIRLVLSIIACSLLAEGAGAQCLINVDFGAGSRSPKTGFAATGQGTNDFWNLFRLYDPNYIPGEPLVFSGRQTGLKQADGAATEVSIDLTNAPGVWGNATGDAMYDSYVFAPDGSNMTATISRLNPGRYNFFLYGHADPDSSGEQNSLFKLHSAGTNYGPLTTVSSAGWKAAMPWQEGHQYVVFRDVEVQAGSPVVIEIAPGPNGVAVLNGLQISSKGTSPPRLAGRGAAKVAEGFTNLIVREIRYDGAITDHEARFAADLQIESFTTNEISAPLFQGDVAVAVKFLPASVRVVRSGDQYYLRVAGIGVYNPKLVVVAKITRDEPWNQVNFQGPLAAIASIHAQAAGEGVELQLLSGTALENEKAASQVDGFLNASREVSLRWQSRTAEVARNALIAVETGAGAQITPAVIKLTTTLRYELLQASVPRLRIALPASQALTRLQGEQIRDWRIETDNGRQILAIEFVKPVEKNYQLVLFTEQSVESLPGSVQITAPEPLGVEREAGSLIISAADTVVDIGETTGLRRVNANGDALAAFLFSARPFSLAAGVKRVEPVLTVADRVTARLEESRLAALHAVDLTVDKAGIYSVEFTPQPGFGVAGVTGEGVEDWKVNGGKLQINFASRVLGLRHLEVQLEQALKSFPSQITLAPLRASGASHETAEIGAAAARGLQVKTGEMTGLREIPAAELAHRTDELLAYSAAQPDWNLTLATERLAPRIGADIFNLITIGDGVVGGSATVRYDLINQGVQEFHLQAPAHWRNMEFTGPNIRSHERQGDLWTIRLQEKAWDGYTLVVTYDYPFDATNAMLDAGGLHAPEAEHETGSVAVTTAAGFKVQAGPAQEPLRVIDPTELAESDRALVTRPVVLAYHYTGHSFALQLQASRQEEAAVLEAVVDRVQMTSVLTDAGEMLAQASFMVKNNGKQFQRFELPPGAEFWGCYVDGQSAKAQKDNDGLLISLPQRADRDEAFAVDIVYAQNSGLAQARWFPRHVAFQAPKTDLPNTFAEWELFVPNDCHVSAFGGSMKVARGTTYGWRDGLRRFGEFYAGVWEDHGAGLVTWIVVLLIIVMAAMQAQWRGFKGLLQVLAVLAIIAILASMMLPALSRAKQKAQRISAVNNLKQIGVAVRIWADEHGNHLPVNLWEDAHDELGNSQKILIDPDSGEPFVYVGAGKSANDANAIIAFSPVDHNGRAVLFGDGSVQQMSSERFADAEAAAFRGAYNLLPSAGPATKSARVRGEEKSLQAAEAPAAATIPASAPATLGEEEPKAPSALPAVAGLRSIHIEIPRQGQPFTFTKVLNTSGEPLSIKMSVMNAVVFVVLRSGFQLAAFITGLLLVWWQWHHKQSSFWIMVGIALSLCAVAALLIASRVLHLALIMAVPIAVLAAVVMAFRKFRPRHAAEPPSPPESGLPSAVAAIALLLALTQPVSAQVAASADKMPGTQSAIESASYTGVISEHVAQFEGTLLLTSTGTNQILPLFGEEAALEDFSVKSGEAKLLREGGKLGVLLPNRGDASVVVRFVVKVGGEVARRHLSFAIPPALASRLSASIDEPDADVEFSTAVAFQRTSDARQTRLDATIGPADRVDIQWTPRIKRAAEVAATIFVDNNALATLSNGVMDVRSVLDFQISQGEMRQARVCLPVGQRLLRVDGESIRTWQLQPQVSTKPSGDILVVDLLKGVSPDYKLSVETEKILDRFPITVAVEVPRALDVKRETGLIAVRGSEELSLSVDRATELERVDAADFPLPDKTANLFSVWRFLNPGFALAVRAETVQPQIEAVVHNTVRISTDQIALSTTIEYGVKRAGVFALQAALPASYTVENVQGENMLPWQVRDTGSNRLLEIPFKDRVLGGYSLRVDLLRLLKEFPSTVAIPGVHPLNVQKLDGAVFVEAEPGVAVKTSSFDGLSESPGISPGTGANAAAGVLAYKFLSAQPGPLPDWKLEVACEKVESWVRADIAQIVVVSDNLLSGAAVIRYDIQNAPVKDFHLKIPASCTNVEFSAPDIRRRDQVGEDWHVELQNAVHGQFTLVVNWERPVDVKTNALDLDGIQALGLERESGYVLVLSKSALQVTEKSASGELMKIDASELPDWVESSDRPVLVYRYVRPGYKLNIEARHFEDAAVLQALADQVHLTTVLTDDGQAMTEMALQVRNNGLQHLEIELPVGAQVWSAFVGGQAVRPARRDQKLFLPLEATAAAADAPVSIELTYLGRETFPKRSGKVNLISPRLGVPLKNARWDVYLPPDYDYTEFTGSMLHEAGAAPAVLSYSLLEYRAQEANRKQSRENEAQAFLSNARTKLANGDVLGINNADTLNSFSGASPEARQEMEALQKDLARVQHSNLMQQQRVYSHGQVAASLPSGSAGQNRPASAESEAVAGEQWNKLQQAQELAVARVQPLRVSLPTRGLRQSFTQVLQTEVAKPLTIQFSAVNTETGGLLRNTLCGALALAVLWAFVAAFLNARRNDSTHNAPSMQA
ncbi:MAG: type II secretion system protein [Limisphaerales bacterium]